MRAGVRPGQGLLPPLCRGDQRGRRSLGAGRRDRDGFTIITPVAYYGQKETEPFVYASVLLDGADTPLGGQDITGVPHDQLRMGLRVKAKWKPKKERSVAGMSNRGWAGLGDVIESFEATGEPDAGTDVYKEHIF